MLKDKKIIIGVTGSIAAFKVAPLIRLLTGEGAMVQVVMTPAAHDFVTPLTLATLSGQPVLTDSFNPEDGYWNSHVELGLWADLMLIVPASANTEFPLTTLKSLVILIPFDAPSRLRMLPMISAALENPSIPIVKSFVPFFR